MPHVSGFVNTLQLCRLNHRQSYPSYAWSVWSFPSSQPVPVLYCSNWVFCLLFSGFRKNGFEHLQKGVYIVMELI